MKLNEKARQQLEAELGIALPTEGAELNKVIEDIRITRPDLLALTNQLHEVPNLPLPEEAEASKAARRERRQETVKTLFYSPSPSGEPALNKRKLLGVVTVLLLLTLPLAFIAQQLHGTAAASPPAPPAQQGPVLVEREVIPLTPGEPFATTQGEPIPAWPEEEELWETPAPVAPAPTTPTPQPVVAAPITTGGQRLPPTPGPVNPAVSGAPPQWGTAQPAPASATAPPPPLLRYNQPRPAAQPLTAFSAEPQPRPPISAYTAPPRAAALSFAPQPVATERAPATAFAAQRPDQTALSVVSPGRAESAALLVLSGNEGTVMTRAPAAQNAQPATPTLWVAPSEAAPGEASTAAAVTVFARPPVVEAAPFDSAQGRPVAAAPAAPPAPQPVQLARPGDRIPAQLTTAIALVEGANAPVVAETPAGGNWCPAAPCPAIIWLGEAALDGNNRVSITFNQAIVDGLVRPVSGLALGLDHLPGLAANLRDATPTAALDLVRAAAGGVSDYVDALIDRRQIIIADGQQIITDLGPPPLGHVVGGRMAQLFQLPTGQTTVVRLAEVPFATTLQVLYGVGSGR
jgi:hypothetical protein